MVFYAANKILDVTLFVSYIDSLYRYEHWIKTIMTGADESKNWVQYLLLYKSRFTVIEPEARRITYRPTQLLFWGDAESSLVPPHFSGNAIPPEFHCAPLAATF